MNRFKDFYQLNSYARVVDNNKLGAGSGLSLTPEYFSRVLHELEAEGLIKIDRRDISILNTRGLASYQLQ